MLAISGISVNDVDGNLASSQLSVTNGTLTVSLAGGATISAGANNSGTLTLSGTQAQINAALATVSYQGNLNFNGSDTLTIVSTDSAGTPLSDTDTIAITVNQVNDAPTVANAIADQTVANSAGGVQGDAYTFTFASNAFEDVDIATNGQVLTYTATLDGVDITGTSHLGLSFDAATRTISGTPTTAGTYNVVVTATDNGVNPANLSVTDTFALEIAPPAALVLLPGQLDGLTNLNVRSQIVLEFSDNIKWADGQIKIMDDMGTAGWTVLNTTTGESSQDKTDNDMIITVASGQVTGMTIGGVDYTALGGVGLTLAELQASFVISGNKLIINPAGDDAASGTDWDFDWDFGANYHVELSAGVVTNLTGTLGNTAVTDGSVVSFTTVAPVGSTTGAASMNMLADGTLANGYIWHSAHVMDPTMGAGMVLDFGVGAHALYMHSNGSNTRSTTTAGKVTLQNFSFSGGAFTLDDILYMDNSGNMTMGTTDGRMDSSQWASGTRTLANQDGGLQQVIAFDQTGFPGAWTACAFDTVFENALHYNNTQVIVFG